MIDFSDKQQEALKLVESFGFKDIEFYLPNKNLGCNRAVFNVLDWSFSNYEYTMYLEEDVKISLDCLDYFRWGREKYKDDEDVFAIGAYNRKGNRESKPYSVRREKSWNPWGTALWKDRWLSIRDGWQFKSGKVHKDAAGIPWNGSWDIIVKKVLRGDRYTVFPDVSRCKNVGEYGVHTSSPEWHRAKHNVEYWADDIEVPLNPPPFQEV